MEPMQLWLWTFGCGLWAYLIGSVNITIAVSALLRIRGLRDTGSKNPGVTNLFRVAGAKVAVPVLVLEIAKAFVALLVPRFILAPQLIPYLAILFLLGNLFPLFHGFRGGKGVAATVGAMLVLDYRVMLLGGIGFILVFLLFRRVSAASLSMALSYPLLSYLFWGPGPMMGVTVGLFAVLSATHRSNIKRLVEGTEPRLTRNR